MANVAVERDLPYAVVDDVELTLDIYRCGSASAPVVVYLHGGGWERGDKADQGPTRLAPLAAHGVDVVAVNYRLVPLATFPAPVHDVKGAVRWLRAHGPDLGLSTERLAVWGASAGAYLGSLVALSAGDAALEGDVGDERDHASAVQAVVDWYGPVDLAANGSRTDVEQRLLPFHFEQDLVGARDPAELAARARPLSLLSRVSADAPPFLIAHGDRDRIVPVTESAALNDALGRAGASSRLMVLAGAGHEDAEFDSPAMLAMTAAWLRTVLRPGTPEYPPG